MVCATRLSQGQEDLEVSCPTVFIYFLVIYLFSCEEKQVSATVGITEMTWFCRCLDLGFLFVPRYWNVILTQDFS